MTSDDWSGSRPSAAEEFVLMDLVGMVRRHWKALLTPVIVVPLLAVLYLHLATYRYRADLAVAPPQTSSSGSLGSSLGGGLGGLAALAGVGGASNAGGLNFQLYREGIMQRETAEALARDDWVLQSIFQSEWDAQRKVWAEPDTPVRTIRNALIGLLGVQGRGWSAPDAARLQDHIMEKVSVTTNSKSPVVMVSYTHPDPVFAARFLDRIHAVVDADLRQRLLARTGENIGYLSAKLQQVTIAEHRQALSQALSEQEKLRMTASSTVAFAAEPYGRASATRRPVSPNPVVALAVGVGLGVVLGIIAVLWMELVVGRSNRPDGAKAAP
jgi:uncharacterized protein involved in exopolysaccharide biosynthesis